MLKILQARLQQHVNENFQLFKLVLEKAEEPEIQWEFHKNIYFCFIDYFNAFDCGSQQTVENS